MKSYLREQLPGNLLRREFQDKHAGEDIFLICSGFSAADKVDKIVGSGFRTMGINLTYNFGYTFDYYFCNFEKYFQNPAFYSEFKKYHDRRALFTSPSCHDEAKLVGLEPIGFPVYVKGRRGFGSDFADGIHTHLSAAIDVLQILIGLGFKKIFMVGVDCKFGESAGNLAIHPYDKEQPDPEVVRQTVYEFERNIKSFRLMAQLIKQYAPDVQVFNVNPASAVDAFSKIELTEAFNLCQKRK